eukprot:9478640-Pyramimonas_sp.AAC.2
MSAAASSSGESPPPPQTPSPGTQSQSDSLQQSSQSEAALVPASAHDKDKDTGRQLAGRPSDPTAALEENLYGHRETVFHRYVGAQPGLKLLQKCLRDYGQGPKRVMFFDRREDGKWLGRQLLEPHQLNRRHHAEAVNEAAHSIKEFGNLQDVRGKAIAIPSADPKVVGEDSPLLYPYRLITYGATTRGIYLSYERWPDNEMVKITVDNGLMVEVLSYRTPDDVIEFLRDFFNQFHKGVGITFLELLKKVPAIASALRVYKEKLGVTHRNKAARAAAMAKEAAQAGGPGHSIVMTFLKEKYPGNFDSQNEYDKDARLAIVLFSLCPFRFLAAFPRLSRPLHIPSLRPRVRPLVGPSGPSKLLTPPLGPHCKVWCRVGGGRDGRMALPLLLPARPGDLPRQHPERQRLVLRRVPTHRRDVRFQGDPHQSGADELARLVQPRERHEQDIPGQDLRQDYRAGGAQVPSATEEAA